MKDPRPRSVDSTDYSERLESAPRALLRKSIDFERMRHSRNFWRLQCVLLWLGSFGALLWKWKPVHDFILGLFS